MVYALDGSGNSPFLSNSKKHLSKVLYLVEHGTELPSFGFPYGSVNINAAAEKAECFYGTHNIVDLVELFGSSSSTISLVADFMSKVDGPCHIFMGWGSNDGSSYGPVDLPSNVEVRGLMSSVDSVFSSLGDRLTQEFGISWVCQYFSKLYFLRDVKASVHVSLTEMIAGEYFSRDLSALIAAFAALGVTITADQLTTLFFSAPPVQSDSAKLNYIIQNLPGQQRLGMLDSYATQARNDGVSCEFVWIDSVVADGSMGSLKLTTAAGTKVWTTSVALPTPAAVRLDLSVKALSYMFTLAGRTPLDTGFDPTPSDGAVSGNVISEGFGSGGGATIASFNF